jgi:hypothetical protein
VPEIDPDDLIDAADIAEMLDLSSPRAVSVYRSRYSDFPAPFVSKASGKCVLWLRSDVERWQAARGRRPD